MTDSWGYARISAQGIRTHFPCEAPETLVVDVIPGSTFADLREANGLDFRLLKDVLIRRLPGETDPPMLAQWQARHPTVDVLALEITRAGVTLVREGKVVDDDKRLDAARSCEVSALADWGRAISRPPNYHYLLPSGNHAPAFVRAGNLFHSPRETLLAASWLLRHVNDDTLLVFDTDTISSLALAIRILRGPAAPQPPVEIFDSYPRTTTRIARALSSASTAGCRDVLFVVSVSSTGGLVDTIATAVERSPFRAQKRANISVLVCTGGGMPPEVDCWLNLRNAEAQNPRSCRLCRDSERATLVPIDQSLSEVLPLLRRWVMPDPGAPPTAAEFWTRASSEGAVQLNAEPAEHTKDRRPIGRMPVRIDLDLVFSDPDFLRESIEKGVKDLGTKVFELLLVSEQDRRRPIWGTLSNALCSSLGTEKILSYPLTTESEEQVREAKSILVFSLGAVTGTLLQDGLRSVQYILTGKRDYVLSGLVAHSRPGSDLHWKAVRNSFASSIGTAHLTLLPSWSPLVHEAEALSGLGSLESAERQWVDKRLEAIHGQLTSAHGVFWGARPEDKLTSHSIFGHNLSPVAAYAAIGSAIEHTRQKHADRLLVPVGFNFERIAISYYDPLILAAMIRWIRPWEIYWGEYADAVVNQLLNRGAELRVILPELLLAAAEGKMPDTAAQSVVAKGEAVYGTDPNFPSKTEIGVGLAACRLRGSKVK